MKDKMETAYNDHVRDLKLLNQEFVTEVPYTQEHTITQIVELF